MVLINLPVFMLGVIFLILTVPFILMYQDAVHEGRDGVIHVIMACLYGALGLVSLVLSII